MANLFKSGRSKVLIFSLLIISLFSCSSSLKENVTSQPNEKIINFPKMTIGDEWTIDTDFGIRHRRVIDVSNDGSFILELKREDGSRVFHQFFDNNYRFVKEIDIKSGVYSRLSDPPKMILNFPLFVGKTWELEFVDIPFGGSEFVRYKSTYTVDGIEMKTTKAGEYETVKVSEKQLNTKANKLLMNTIWYSPELKIIIKEAPTWRKGMELLSYRHATGKEDLSNKIGGLISKSTQLSEQPPKIEPITSGMKDIKKPEYSQVATGARWAAIIGISQYKDTRIPSLRYAAADAKAFYGWATSLEGGKYAPAMVKLLIDSEATGENIKKVLFDWLAQAIQEDTVTIFFAGHGSPQSPDHPENLFLLPYDTQYENISTTGFPMWDIETALKRFIKAKKVIIITDACHAGGVGRAFDTARRDGQKVKVPIISTLQNLSTISDGVCFISASDDNQFSQEGLQWGQGHGVFTYFLLEGLKGKADYNKDGLVTLGELIPFLSEQVRRETRNAQTPTVAGRFDPALSIGK